MLKHLLPTEATLRQPSRLTRRPANTRRLYPLLGTPPLRKPRRRGRQRRLRAGSAAALRASRAREPALPNTPPPRWLVPRGGRQVVRCQVSGVRCQQVVVSDRLGRCPVQVAVSGSRVVSREGLHGSGKKESGTCAKTGVDASQPCCTSVFTDSKSIAASPIPWNYSSRSLPIIGFGGLAVLVCWVVVLGVVGLVGACGVGVWVGWWRWSGSLGRRPGFFGVLGWVEDPAGGGVGESEVGEASQVDGCCSGGEPLLVAGDSSVGNASGFPAGEPGDGPFHGRPQVPIGFLGFFFGPPDLVRRPTVVVFVDCDGASRLRGGAPCPQGAAVAPLRERGGATGTYTDVCARRDTSLSRPPVSISKSSRWNPSSMWGLRTIGLVTGVWPSLSNVSRAAPDAYAESATISAPGGWSATRSAMLSASGVLAAVRWAGGDQSGFGFCSDMGLVPVPFAGPGLVTMPGFGIHRRYGPVSGHTPRYPPSALPIRVRFHVLARNHSQQTYRVGLFRAQLHTLDRFDQR